MTSVCIDPGVNNFGLVIYKNVIERKEFQAPEEAMVKLVPSKIKSQSEFHRIDWLIQQMDAEVFQRQSVDQVYCEYPETFGGLVGTAASGRGDTLHLATFCGAVMGMARQYNLPVTFLPVREWKGNMPKDMVNSRIIKAFDRAGLEPVILSKSRSHDWDACGIGTFLMGELT